MSKKNVNVKLSNTFNGTHQTVYQVCLLLSLYIYTKCDFFALKQLHCAEPQAEVRHPVPAPDTGFMVMILPKNCITNNS